MSNELRAQIHDHLDQKDTAELMEIWKTNNHAEWSDMTFDVTQEILQERGADIPPQGIPITEQNPGGLAGTYETVSMNIAQILFSFEGRIGLGTYWLGALSIFAFIIAATMIDVIVFESGPYAGYPTLLGRLVVIWPSLALTVKRWHDRDKSGWWTLLGIVPILGPIWTFIENGLLPGTQGPNQYGLKSF